jgi:peptidoglycan/xylan/chitin deacetylase (PgdA/CDA1 family)
MRLAAAICSVVIIAVLGVFGAVLAQKSAILGPAPAPTEVAAAPVPAAPSAVVADAGPAISTAEPARTVAQTTPAAPVPSPVAAPQVAQAAPAPAAAAPAAPAPVANAVCPGNPDALGVARVVEIDTTGGPGFGFEHFKSMDFLRPGEVVLTFDDGPWPRNTPAVLAALASQCTKALFFPIGKHSMWHPEILKQVAAGGHTIGSHTWSHADLSKKSAQDAKDEIEKGFSAVKWALGAAPSPFFRFPALRHPPEMVTYLGERNIGIFSTDFDSFDFKLKKPEQVVQSVMTKLKKFGKGIVLMHDFQHATADGIAELLKQMKAGGYKVVPIRAKEPAKTLAAYDEMILKDNALPTVTSRPASSVVRTISE